MDAVGIRQICVPSNYKPARQVSHTNKHCPLWRTGNFVSVSRNFPFAGTRNVVSYGCKPGDDSFCVNLRLGDLTTSFHKIVYPDVQSTQTNWTKINIQAARDRQKKLE